jgi:hypothetical protein
MEARSMKRFAPLLLIVFALAAVPAAFADDAPAPSAPAAPAAKAGGHPIARIQLEMLRIRLQLVHLRYQIACHKQDSDRCTQFTQKVTDRLTKLDQNVQDRIAKNCTSTTSTDKRCDVLNKLDQKLQDVIANLGKAAPAPSSSGESGLDNAAGSLAGSAKP